MELRELNCFFFYEIPMELVHGNILHRNSYGTPAWEYSALQTGPWGSIPRAPMVQWWSPILIDLFGDKVITVPGPRNVSHRSRRRVAEESSVPTSSDAATVRLHRTGPADLCHSHLASPSSIASGGGQRPPLHRSQAGPTTAPPVPLAANLLPLSDRLQNLQRARNKNPYCFCNMVIIIT